LRTLCKKLLCGDQQEKNKEKKTTLHGSELRYKITQERIQIKILILWYAHF